jgi:hypothetical protein
VVGFTTAKEKKERDERMCEESTNLLKKILHNLHGTVVCSSPINTVDLVEMLLFVLK